MATSRFTFTGRARPVVQVSRFSTSSGTTVGSALWDVALWDVDRFAAVGNDVTWTDASCYAMQVDTQAGRGRVTDRFEVGRFEVVFDNESGWANPIPMVEDVIDGGTAAPPSGLLASSDVDGGDAEIVGAGLVDGGNAPPDDVPVNLPPTIELGQQIRVGVDHSIYGLMWKARGFIDDVEPRFAADDWSTVVVRAIDSLGECGRAAIANISPAASGFVHDRINTILDDAPWTDGKRDIDEVGTELISATLDGKVVDLLRRSADSAGGWVFGDTEANVVFKGPGWLNTEASRHEQFVITNDSTVDANIVCPSMWSRPARRSDITARVIVQTPPSEAETYESTDAIRDKGAETISIRDLWTASPADRETIATRLLTARSPQTVPRVEAVTLHADTDPAALDLATLVDAASLTRVRARHLDPATREAIFDDQCFVTGVKHHMTADEWSVELSLDRSDFYVVEGGPAYWDQDDWNDAFWSEAA